MIEPCGSCAEQPATNHMIADKLLTSKNQAQEASEGALLGNSDRSRAIEVTLWHDLPSELRNQVSQIPNYINGKLLYKRYVGRDPLSYVAYFDAVDLTHNTIPVKKEADRRRARHERQEHYSVNIHADLLRVKSLAAIGGLSPSPAGGGLRGVISGFSQQSRMRLLQFMASIRLAEHIVFLTITYPDEFPIGDVDAWLAHFEAFRRRFERMFPRYRVIWRKELKPRLSGDNRGKIAPHYHMLIFTDAPQDVEITVEQIQNRGLTIEKSVSALSKFIENWAQKIWSEIVDSDDENHEQHGAFAVACRNRRHAYKYVSKYIAKIENDDFEVGRRWGRIGAFDTDASFTCVISKQEFVELLRMARAWMRSRGSDYSKKLVGVSRGRSIFGLGDGLVKTNDTKNPLGTVFRMLFQASSLSNNLSPVPEVSLNITF